MTLPLISRPLAATTLALSSLACSVAARADDDFIVYSPYVTEGQSEVEYRGHQSFDPALDGERAYARYPDPEPGPYRAGWLPE